MFQKNSNNILSADDKFYCQQKQMAVKFWIRILLGKTTCLGAINDLHFTMAKTEITYPKNVDTSVMDFT